MKNSIKLIEKKKKKIATTRVNIFLVTRISENKSFVFFWLYESMSFSYEKSINFLSELSKENVNANIFEKILGICINFPNQKL